MVLTFAGGSNGSIEIYRLHIPRFSWRGFKKNELKPWKVKGWVIPPAKNGEFVANMEHVLDVYKEPYDEDYPVVCMDESLKQLIEEVASTSIMPGQDARVDYEYVIPITVLKWSLNPKYFSFFQTSNAKHSLSYGKHFK